MILIHNDLTVIPVSPASPDKNRLFVSKGVKKMIDESDKFIDVSQKLKGGMDEAVAISRHRIRALHLYKLDIVCAVIVEF